MVPTEIYTLSRGQIAPSPSFLFFIFLLYSYFFSRNFDKSSKSVENITMFLYRKQLFLIRFEYFIIISLDFMYPSSTVSQKVEV